MTRSRIPSRAPRRLLFFGILFAALVAPLAGLAATAETALAASGDCTTGGGFVSCTFTYTGAAQSWTVPSGITQVTFDLYGAQGGDGKLISSVQGYGGLGARAQATFAVSAGQSFQIMVGGAGSETAGGFNGGGTGGASIPRDDYGGGGGGASDVRTGACVGSLNCTLAERTLIAGGGGGGTSGPYRDGNGGSGGQIGSDGASDSSGGADPGFGASATSGGAGGIAANFGSTAGAAGQLGQGGNGGNPFCGCGGGGAGGGGLYGGGGAGSNAGGGGGSSYGPAGTVFTTGANIGDGRVVISYPDTTPPSVTVNQAAGQADPTDTNPVLFTAEFSEPVIGFTNADVALGGTADLSKANVTVTGGPSSYTISVDGVAGNGTVTASVAANAAADAGGNGNTASTSTDNTVTVQLDSTPPVISASVAGPLGSNGWYVGDATLTWTVTDPESSVTTTDCGPQNITADTTLVTFTCTATSAGGSDSQSVEIKRDATKPIVVSGTPDRAPNAGWYNAPVTVKFAGSDVTSGIASCTSPTYSGPDSATATVSGTCTDNAGNVSSLVSFSLKYDATAPVLAPTVTPNPASLNLPAIASPNATDTTSGVASSSCAAPNTASTGAKSVNCTATDNAGNTATANASYTVVNDPPTLAVAPGGTCAADGSASGSINFTVGDANTGPNGLMLRVVSNSNTTLVPNSKVLFGGSGANRTMSVTAAAKKNGTAVLIIGVSDGTNTTTLVVTVQVISSGVATLTGAAGTDMLFGGNAVDTLNGLGGNDLLCGGNGVDTLNGGDGADTLNGNRGNDLLTGGPGADRFSGGPGTDGVTDFTPSQGDTQDGTVENVTVLAAGVAAADSTAPKISSRIFLPTVQH